MDQRAGDPPYNGGAAYGRVELTQGFGNLPTREQVIYTSNFMLLMTRAQYSLGRHASARMCIFTATFAVFVWKDVLEVTL